MDLSFACERYTSHAAFAAEARLLAARAAAPDAAHAPRWFTERNAPLARSSGVHSRLVDDVLFDVAHCPAEIVQLHDESRGVRDLRLALAAKDDTALEVEFPHLVVLRSNGAALLAVRLHHRTETTMAQRSAAMRGVGDGYCAAQRAAPDDDSAWQLPRAARCAATPTTPASVAARLRDNPVLRALTLCGALQNLAPMLLLPAAAAVEGGADGGAEGRAGGATSAADRLRCAAVLPGVALRLRQGAAAPLCIGGAGLAPTAPAPRELSALLIPVDGASALVPLLLDAAARSVARAKQLRALLGGESAVEEKRCAIHGDGVAVYTASPRSGAAQRPVNRRATLLCGVVVRGRAVVLQRSTALRIAPRRSAAWPAALCALPARDFEDAAGGRGGGTAALPPPPPPLPLDGAERTGCALHALLARAAADPACFDAQLRQCADDAADRGVADVHSALCAPGGGAVAHVLQLRALLDAHGASPRTLARLVGRLPSSCGDRAARRVPALLITASTLHRVLQRRLRVQAAAVGERGAALVSAASVAAAFLTDCVGQPCARASSSDLWSTEFPAELVLGPHGAFDQHAVLSVVAVLPSGSRRAPCPHALIGPLLAECGLRLRPAACRALQEQGALPSTQRVWRSAEDGSDFAPSAALPRIANGRDEVAVLERALRRTLECELRSSWEGEEKAPEGGARRSAAVEQRRYEALVTAVFGGGEAERELPSHTSGGRATRAGAAARTRALLARGGGAQAAARAALRSDDALVPLELVHALTSDALRTTLSAAKHIPTLRRRVALVARALRATLECGVTAHMPTADAVARALLTVYLHELCALAGKLKRKMPTRLVTLAALAEERANCASASGGAWQSNAELIDAFDVARGAARGAGASGRAAPRATLEAIVALGAKDATALPGAARSSGANAELRAAALAASKGAAAEEAGCDDASRYLEGIWSGRGGAGNARGGGDYGGVVAWGLPTGLDGEVEMVLDWKTQGPFNEWHVPIAEATADGVELQRGAPPCGCRRDVRPSTVVVRVACGYRHTALITQRGSLLTFGHGVCGRLGHGDEVDRRAPTVVAALAECEVVAASCGREHTAALTADGRVFTWGWGEAGRLGHGDEDPLSAPRSVAFFAATHSVERIGVATAVACGREHTLVCTAGGALFAFGAGSSYRLGTGDQEDRLKPVRIDTDALAGELVCALAGGEAHSAALCRSGSLFTWGFGRAGALGHGGDEHEKTPRRLEHPQRVASVACGAYHTAFVTAPGELWSCGDGSSGQLGVCPEGLDATQTALDDFTVLSSSAPRRQRVGEGGREQRTIVSVECGFWQTVACDAGGRLYRWGACGGERALGARIEERGVGGALAAARLGAAENVWSHAGVGRWQTIACTAAIGHSSISSAMRSSCDAGAAVLEGDARVKARCSRFAPPLPFPSHDRGTSTHVVLLGVHDVRRAAVPVDTALGVTHLESLAPHSIVSIASGAAHSLALTANGAVFAWGASGRGGAGPAALCATSSGAQGADADFERGITCSVPCVVRALRGAPAMRVSAGGASSAAVLLDGSVVVWGGGVPLRVLFERSAAAGASFQDGGSDAVDVACAAGNVITLFESGRLATRRCVGAAASASAAEVEGEGGAAAAVSAATLATDHGEVGGGGANADADAAAAPARPSPAQRPIAIVAGATGRVLGCALHGAVLRGALYAGGGETLPQWRPLTLAPIRVLGRVRALCVACGDAHSAVVTQAGRVYTWGANARGQLGLGDMVDRQSPQMVAVRPAQAALLVACGAEHTAIATSGARGEGAGHQLFTAGNAEHGRLGRVGAGEYTTLRVASRLHAALPKRCAIVDLSAGAAHTLVLWRAHRGTRS